MDAQQALAHVERTRIIAILRGEMHGREIEIVEALVAGGITAIEVSAVTPRFAAVIARLQEHFQGRAAIGAGTVLTSDELKAVVGAGGTFVVSPNTNANIIRQTRDFGLASFPGAYTASEVVFAAESGADAVKLFPAVSLGPEYVKALRGPLPQIKLVPTGGIHLQNIKNYIAAGAFAVGIGSELVGKAELERLIPERLREKAQAYADAARKSGDD